MTHGSITSAMRSFRKGIKLTNPGPGKTGQGVVIINPFTKIYGGYQNGSTAVYFWWGPEQFIASTPWEAMAFLAAAMQELEHASARLHKAA